MSQLQVTTRTPPHGEQLLTPPPSGGYEDTSFFDVADKQQDSCRIEGDSKEPQSSLYLEHIRQDPVNHAVCRGDLGADSAFPFMQLPLSVRKRIYTILLTVPAIICVRQNHTAYHRYRQAYLFAEHRELLPGIAYALCQASVDGHKFRLSHDPTINIAILRVNKEVSTEAKTVMYGANHFEVSNLSDEMSPQPNFSVPLFPRGYQRLIRNLTFRMRSPYVGKWLVGGGYHKIKNAYRCIAKLTLILELDTVKKGFAKKWIMKTSEDWADYVKRLHSVLSLEFFGRTGVTNVVPTWVAFVVLFGGESYLIDVSAQWLKDEIVGEEDAYTAELKDGLLEAFELFKKSGH